VGSEFDTVLDDGGYVIDLNTYKSIEEANERLPKDAEEYINSLINQKQEEIALLKAKLHQIRMG
jgi:hypothetical protein